MRASTEDRAGGTLEQWKGKLKRFMGILSGRTRLQARGERMERSGKVRVKLGEVEKVVGK